MDTKAIKMTPSRPYFIRALYEWILHNLLKPHVMLDALLPGVSVPENYVQNGKIVFDISPEAVANLDMTNDWVNFDAKFSGVNRRIRLPVQAILGIYAFENNRGMMFDPEDFGGHDDPSPKNPSSKRNKKQPQLKIVK